MRKKYTVKKIFLDAANICMLVSDRDKVIGWIMIDCFGVGRKQTRIRVVNSEIEQYSYSY